MMSTLGGAENHRQAAEMKFPCQHLNITGGLDKFKDKSGN
jgi:hypothetical protein